MQKHVVCVSRFLPLELSLLKYWISFPIEKRERWHILELYTHNPIGLQWKELEAYQRLIRITYFEPERTSHQGGLAQSTVTFTVT